MQKRGLQKVHQNRVSVQEANATLREKRSAEDVKKKEIEQFREKGWEIRELLSQGKFDDAAKLADEMGWEHGDLYSYSSRSEAWDAEVGIEETIHARGWSKHKGGLSFVQKEVSTVLHSLAKHYAPTRVDDNVVVDETTTKVMHQDAKEDEPSIEDVIISAPRIIANVPYPKPTDGLEIDPIEISQNEYDVQTLARLASSVKIKVENPVPKKEITPTLQTKLEKMEAEVTRVLGQTKAYRERAGRLNSSNRVNAFESINEYEERMKGKVTNEDRHFYETSPFALANDDFAMYVSRHNSDNYLLSSRISLVFEDGEKHGEKGFEHVNRDLEGMIRILRSKDLKHSFAVLQQALEIRKELERGRYVVAHAIAEGIDPDKYGVHDKLELLLEEHGVTGKMENMYMERAHQAYIWGDWKNCLKHSNLAQEIDRDHDSEIERIAHLSRTMIDIENARARDDYVVAMALYDNAIALMDGHVWNDNQRFSDLKNITREVAAKDLKKKAKKATGTDRAVLLEQWSHVDPTASKTWTFRRLSKKEKKGIFSLFARR